MSEVKPFNEIASSFPHDLPEETYNSLKKQYFDHFVAPKIPEGFSHTATWSEFDKATQRPHVLDQGQRLLAPIIQPSLHYTESLLRPLKDLEGGPDKLYEHFKSDTDNFDRLAAREGISHEITSTIASGVGTIQAFTMLEKGLGVSGAIPAAEELLLTGKAASLFDRTMRGGTAFATYEAAVANKEEKGVAALKGFAMGAGLDVGLSLAGKLLHKGIEARNVDKIVRDALTPGKEVDPEVDQIISDHIQQDIKSAKQEGRVGFLNETRDVRGITFKLRGPNGPLEVKVKPEQEYDAVQTIQQHIQNGAEPMGIDYHPDEISRVNRFLRLQEKIQEKKYEQRVVKTAPDQSAQVASQMQREGHTAEPISHDTVVVSPPLPKVPTKDQVKEVLFPFIKDSDELSNRAGQITQLWNPKLPTKSAQVMLESLKQVVKPSVLNELLPEHLKVVENAIPIITEKSPEVLEAARELGVSEDRIIGDTRESKVQRLFGLLDLPSADNQYIRMQAEDILIELGHDPEKVLLDDLAGAKDTKELEGMLKSKEIEDVLTSEIAKKSKDITFPGAMEEAVRKGEVKGFSPLAKRNTILYHGTSWENADSIRQEGLKRNASLGQKKLYTDLFLNEVYLSTSKEHVETYGQWTTVGENATTNIGARWARIHVDTYGLRLHPDPDYFDEETIAQNISRYHTGDISASRIKKIEYFDEQGKLSHTWEPEGSSQPKIKIPQSESQMVEITLSGPRVVGRQISVNPSRVGIKVTPEEMEEFYPGASALTVRPGTKDWSNVLQDLGISVTGEIEGKPLNLYSKINKEEVWHENTHIGIVHAGSKGVRNSWAVSEQLGTAIQIADRFGTYAAYKGLSKGGQLEEAFVHSATAVRMNDLETLGRLASWDTSVRHVLDMVHDFGEKALEQAGEQVDSYPIRIFQRSISNVLAKAARENYWELRIQAHLGEANAYLDPLEGIWKFLTAGGKVTTTQEFNQMVDHIGEQLGESFAPSASLPLEMRGVRGPIVPRGSQPTKNLPLPDAVPENIKGVGWKAVSGAWRPMLPWVAGVDEKLNEAFSVKGQKFPIYDAVKKVDTALREGDDWLINQKELAADFLKGNPKKLYDYMDVLTTEEKYWPQMQRQFRLGDEDMINLRRAQQWLQDFQSDTHIPAFNYLRDQLPKLRGFNFNLERVYGGRAKESSDMSFFHKAIVEGKLNPQDAHLGRFFNFLIREGFEKKFTAEPIKELRKLVDLKGKEGGYILGTMRWPLENYVNYVRGIPDTTAQIMYKVAGDFQKGLGQQFKRLNKYLPEFAQLPEEFNYPGNFINRMMTLSYVGSLGARPAIAIRDAMQMLTTSLPVLGEKFFKGISGMSPEGFQRAEEAGALLTKVNIGELYGDIFGEMPAGGNLIDKATQLSNKLLAPSRWGHNVARSVAYNAEYESSLDAVQKYRAGVIDAHGLLTNSSMWWYDQPMINNLLRDAADLGMPAEEVAKRSALELVDLTLWPYRRGAQPTLLRTGLGRIFGQYGMWPMNYMDFLARGVRKFHQFPAQSLKSAAFWTGSNYAVVAAMNGMGADVGKWFFTSPASYAGSPHLELVQNMAKMMEETDEGRKARGKVMEYPLNFIPTFNEIKAVMKSIDDGGPMFMEDGNLSPNFLRIMGFKPLDEAHTGRVGNLSDEDRLKYELGYKQVR